MPAGASPPPPPIAATIGLTAVALVAFAGNSLLCRMALRPRAIDPGSFALLRVAAGAALLHALARRRPAAAPGPRGSWTSAIALAAYAVGFTFAYLALDAAVGTLALFGAVQGTMIGQGLRAGERPPLRTWLGFAAAIAGLLLLLVPGIGAPDPAALLAMTAAGVAWGIYSLRGRGNRDPLGATAANFARAAPLCLCAAAAGLPFQPLHVELRGALLAIASGAITSGLGYVVWYAAVRRLTATAAGMAQLAVPVLAALGGVLLLGETLTTRLLLGGACVLVGTATALLARRR